MTPKPVLVVILFTLLLQLSQVSSLNFENANQNDDEAAISPSDDDGQHLLQRGGFSVARPSCALTKNCSTIYNAVCVYKTEEKGEKSLLRKGTCACKIGQFLEDGSRCILIQCHSNEDCHRGLGKHDALMIHNWLTADSLLIHRWFIADSCLTHIWLIADSSLTNSLSPLN